MKRLVSIITASLVLLLSNGANAGLHVDVGDLELPPGQSGFVDLTVRSNASDALDSFGMEFRIETEGTTQLEFVAVPPFSGATDPHLNDPKYLFSDDSAAKSFPPAGSISTTSAPNDTYIGGDGTLLGTDVLVPDTDTLLTRLEVTAATSAPPVLGDTFTISLIEGPFTSFSSPQFDPIDYTSTPGRVNIVPEPCSYVICLIWGLLALAGLVVARRRRKSTV